MNIPALDGNTKRAAAPSNMTLRELMDSDILSMGQMVQIVKRNHIVKAPDLEVIKAGTLWGAMRWCDYREYQNCRVIWVMPIHNKDLNSTYLQIYLG